MASITLLSDDIWKQLSKLSKKHKRIYAAISYVTAKHLDFHKGDILVCDASDAAVKGGLTSALTLRAFYNNGAELYSYTGLHSKVAIIDNYAVIGSANLSQNAGVHTCEASLITDDSQIAALVQGFIEKVKRQAENVNEVFLRHIENIRVVRTAYIRRKSKRKIQIGKSRVWFISTSELSEQVIKSEEAYEIDGKKAAEKHIVKKGYSVESIRFSGRSRFRSEAKPGDVIIEAYTEKRGKRKFVEIYPPRPIIYKQDHANWTRFYIEEVLDDIYYQWKDIKADFAKLGVKDITPNSTRELKGKALGILQQFE